MPKKIRKKDKTSCRVKRNKRIVTIGGGSGQYILLSGLRDVKNVDITAVVSMVDSGGSTGKLRDELGVLPPGDALKCVLALSPDREAARKILLTRFRGENRLNGHNAGNMLLSMLGQFAGNFPDGINALGEILSIKGQVLPVTIDKATLVAELADGRHLYGETTIDVPRGNKRQKIKRTFLVPHHSESIRVYPPVVKAILQADFIIIGPGDLYTSITPNFLVPGVIEALLNSKARLVYVVNTMTKFGETDNFRARDFVEAIETALARKIDHILVNKKKAAPEILSRYKKQKAAFVEIDSDIGEDGRYVITDIISTRGGIVRHDSRKLADSIAKLIR